MSRTEDGLNKLKEIDAEIENVPLIKKDDPSKKVERDGNISAFLNDDGTIG